MGHWERNLIIFGAAGVLALAGVFVSGNLALGMTWTFVVLAVALFLALGRFGPDRATLEEWLIRRWQYSRSVKRYTYIQPADQQRAQPVARPKPAPAPRSAAGPVPSPPAVRPVSLADDPGAYYGAVVVLLLVAGVVFVEWLRAGGDAALAHSLQFLIGR